MKAGNDGATGAVRSLTLEGADRDANHNLLYFFQILSEWSAASNAFESVADVASGEKEVAE